MTQDLKTLRRELVRLLKRLSRAQSDERTPLLRSVAETLVSGREHFQRADGTPDWNGRSYAYRQWVREAFTDAGLTGDDASTTQAAIRYHVGTVLRGRLDEDTLADYGMIAASPRERSAERRQGRTATLNALMARDVAGGALLAITAARNVLAGVEADELGNLDGHAAEVAGAGLADIERRVKRLRKALPPTG